LSDFEKERDHYIASKNAVTGRQLSVLCNWLHVTENMHSNSHPVSAWLLNRIYLLSQNSSATFHALLSTYLA